MKNRRHTPEQVIRKLAEADKLLAQGKTVEEVVRDPLAGSWYPGPSNGSIARDGARRVSGSCGAAVCPNVAQGGLSNPTDSCEQGSRDVPMR
jgi:hypothetical protein